jgi:SsrA-binding protein
MPAFFIPGACLSAKRGLKCRNARENRGAEPQARHEYHIEETLEAGIVLLGTEIKSVREGRVNMADSYAEVRNGELWLIDMHISPYSHASVFNHEPMRKRKLLVHKEQIRRLSRKVEEKGYTLIPLSIYFVKGRLKAEIALARGKKKYDKREAIKRRDMDRADARGEDY